MGSAGGGGGDGCRRASRGAGPRHIELGERVGILLVARLRLEDNPILVSVYGERLNLPLAESVVERIGDALHRHAQPSGLFAIDVDPYARPAFLRFGSDLAQGRVAPQTPHQLVRPFDDLVPFGGDERVLVLRPAHARGYLDV